MMRGASADAYAAAAAVLPGTGDLGRVGQDLFGTADLLRAEPGLRRVATDVSLRGEAKADLLRGVLGDKVSSGGPGRRRRGGLAAVDLGS